jgi:hypothetical protein
VVTKTCTQCKRNQPLGEFETDRRSLCHTCKVENFHNWYWANWTNHNDKARIKNLTGRHSFGRSLAGQIEWLNQ